MRLFRSVRWLLLALVVFMVPASSFAGVFISVGFAPPPLVVYDQPPCPEPGWMWMPGYWAYGDDGYYWVPGSWVPAPYEGALWTPGYWGWNTGLYMWHPGYWGRHVGYYGGVNYGFGYMGIGFVGGMWRGHNFAYNTAVMHVNRSFIHTTYDDRTIVERNTIADRRRVAYSGGPGGVRHDPTREERAAMHEQHMGRTSFQTQHVEAAMQDRSAYFRNNHGRPNNVAVERPMAPQGRTGPGARPNTMNRPNPNNGSRNGYEPNRGGQNPLYQGGRDQTARPNNNPGSYNNGGARPAPQQPRQMEQQRPQPQVQPRQQQQPRQFEPRQQPEARPQPRPQPQVRPEPRPQERPQARPQEHQQPRNESRDRKK